MLYIGVTTYDRCEKSLECLDSVLANTESQFSLIVADDCSQDGTRGALELWVGNRAEDRPPNLSSIVILPSEVNLGIAKNKNRIIDLALRDERCKYLILLEDD